MTQVHGRRHRDRRRNISVLVERNDFIMPGAERTLGRRRGVIRANRIHGGPRWAIVGRERPRRPSSMTNEMEGLAAYGVMVRGRPTRW